MKKIDAIIIHCSATRAGQDLRAKDIVILKAFQNHHITGIPLASVISEAWTRPESLLTHVLLLKGQHCVNW